MYAKLFASIYQGTLRGNTNCLVVFTNMLAHADSAGWVDMHPRAIAEEVGLSIEQVQSAIDELEAPDEQSRSPEESGRRIVRLDEHRAWGWRVVNHAKYRAIRSEEDRREQNRLAQERFREKRKADSNESKPRKPRSAQAEAEAEAEANRLHPSDVVADGDSYRVPNCPFQEILALYHSKLPMLSRVRVLSNMRMKHTQARWKEVCSAEKFKLSDALDWFGWYFGKVAASKFLTGKTTGHDGRVWSADFEWLMNGNNFAKVIEGRYHE